MDCQCGCDERALKGSFKPGHDQRLRADLERRVGGILNLRSLVEAAENYSTGKSDSEELAKRVEALFGKSGKAE